MVGYLPVGNYQDAHGLTPNTSRPFLMQFPRRPVSLYTHHAPLHESPTFSSSLPESCEYDYKGIYVKFPFPVSILGAFPKTTTYFLPLLYTAPHTLYLFLTRSTVFSCGHVSCLKFQSSGEHAASSYLGILTTPSTLLAFNKCLLRT